ncbi:MAG: NTP pyrophosphatase (non-canonical NTP hydrolase) [Psychroserpens sp.]|jgi:NTP pyrophosphatase (non-canonical NTP hydrolase)
MENISGSLPLIEYETAIKKTDRFPKDELTPVILGLFGEVGSIMSATKKYRREKKAYVGYKEAVEEEFGDALWYFTAICRRFDLSIADVFESAFDANDIKTIAASDNEDAPLSQTITPAQVDNLDKTLIKLGTITADLLNINSNTDNNFETLVKFARVYIESLHSIELSFAKVARGNIKKTIGRFEIPELCMLPDFDIDFPTEEQLPRKFEIEISERKSGQSYLKWNGVFLGSPLTDNILDPDGYRFHDVFHLAFVAILHWSPTFRALIKHKRKSDPVFDEAQDSGRAIVVEEGLTAWLYSYSKGLDYFEGHDSVSFDVLKTIEKFVSGYEVQDCPLKLWEDAILQGYAVFRKVQRNNGGIVIGDRSNRTLEYRLLGDRNES